MRKGLGLSVLGLLFFVLVSQGCNWVAERQQRRRISTIATGMSVSEVKAILGSPKETRAFGDQPGESQLCAKDRPDGHGVVFAYDLQRGRKFFVLFTEGGAVACSGLEVTHK
jgi:hypothetical protein